MGSQKNVFVCVSLLCIIILLLYILEENQKCLHPMKRLTVWCVSLRPDQTLKGTTK